MNIKKMWKRNHTLMISCMHGDFDGMKENFIKTCTPIPSNEEIMRQACEFILSSNNPMFTLEEKERARSILRNRK